MPGHHAAYPPEFKRQIVELVRSGRTPEELAKEFEPSAGAIRTWVKQTDLDEGIRSDGLTTEERGEDSPCSHAVSKAPTCHRRVLPAPCRPPASRSVSHREHKLRS